MDMYEYKVNSEPFSPMTDIDDGDDAALIEILRWVYNAQVFMDSDRRITWQEELRYIVRGHDVEKIEDVGNAIKWRAAVRVFDIRDQADKTLEFRVADKQAR